MHESAAMPFIFALLNNLLFLLKTIMLVQFCSFTISTESNIHLHNLFSNTMQLKFQSIFLVRYRNYAIIEQHL